MHFRGVLNTCGCTRIGGGIAYTNESIQIELLLRPKHDVKLLFAPAPARNPIVILRGGGGVGA